MILISPKLGDIGASMKAGIETTATLSSTFKSNGSVSSTFFCSDTSGSSIHTCGTCVEGKINFVISAGVNIKLLSTIKISETIASLNINLGKWYFSDEVGFGFGTCPNLAYKTTFVFTDLYQNENGISISPKLIVDDVELGKNKTFYCHNGRHKFTVVSGDITSSGYFDIYEESKEITYSVVGKSIQKENVTSLLREIVEEIKPEDGFDSDIVKFDETEPNLFACG